MNDTATVLSNNCPIFNASDYQGFTNFEYLFYMGCGVTGTVLNVLTLLIAFTSIGTHNRPRQLLVINMTGADLLMCLVYMTTRPYLHYMPIVACYPYYVTICSVALASCIFLLWLNVDKLLFLQFPLHYHDIVNWSRMISVCVTTWIFVIALALFVYHFMAYFSLPMIRCDKVSLPAIIYTPICLLYVLAIALSFAISLTIFLIAENSGRIKIDARPRLFRRLLFVFMSTLWTFFTCLPYRLLYLSTIVHRQFVNNYCPSRALVLLIDIFFRMLVVGTVVNPTITVLTHHAYRRRLAIYLRIVSTLLSFRRNSQQHFEHTDRHTTMIEL